MSARVSVAPVSRALNDAPGVGAPTRARVREAARRVGYQRFEPAAALPRGGGAGRPTMAEVADRAGVSSATVSRVLSGAPHVADATRVRVREAAAQLGYEVCAAASSLSRRGGRGAAVSGEPGTAAAG